MRALLEEVKQQQVAFTSLQIQQAVDKAWVATQMVLVIMGLLLVCYSYVVCAAYAVSLAALGRFKTSVIRRQVHVWWTACVVSVFYLLTKARTEGPFRNEELQDRAWLFFHQVVARFLVQQIGVLGGFWTKIGQSMSVNPAFPEPYGLEFKQLQDAAPSTDISDIMAIIRASFGAEKAGRIVIDESAPPLGVASVAQVHRATYHSPGAADPKDIVVKVQHPGAATRFRNDLWASDKLTRLMAAVKSESFPDMRPILAAMWQVTLNELDFRLEAKNQKHAAATVREANVNVIIPEVCDELVAEKAMAMEYVDGVRLEHVETELPEVDKTSLIFALVDHFGVQFSLDGHFHADPHPGNLMVDRKSGKLVVLDWGMCISIERYQSEGYAKIFHSIATRDVWLLIDALEQVGFKFKAGEVFEPLMFLAAMRFVLRDTQVKEMARGQMKEVMGAHMEIHEKGPKRYKKSPTEMMPGEMIYFGKALNLLFMVSSTLGVSNSTLRTLLCRARMRLTSQEMGDSIPRGPEDFLPRLPAPEESARSPLECKLLAFCHDLYAKGHLMGAQICVLEQQKARSKPAAAPKRVADVTVGVRGWLDTEPVTSDTLFNLLDISKLFVALAVLRLVDRSGLRLQAHLADRWLQLHSDADGRQLTVEQVLGHLAGRWSVLPKEITELSTLLDAEAVLKAFEKAPPNEGAGVAQRYHAVSYGYLCAGICSHLAGRDLTQVFQELAEEAAACEGPSASALTLSLPPKCLAGVAMPTQVVSSANMSEISGMLATMASNLSSEERSAVASARHETFGREHLLHSSLFAQQKVASAVLPGMQAFGTARAAASMLSAVASGRLLAPELVQEMRRSRRPKTENACAQAEEFNQEFEDLFEIDDFKDWGLGAQLVHPQAWGGKVCEKEGLPWGHLSQNGSLLLQVPGPRPVVVALLVNMVDLEASRRVSWGVMRIIEDYVQQGAA